MRLGIAALKLLLAYAATAPSSTDAFVVPHALRQQQQVARPKGDGDVAVAFRRGVAVAATAETTATDSDAAFSAFADSLDEDSLFDDADMTEEEKATWQENLEQLLDPATPLAKRQILLSDLLNANDDIRESVQSALRERKIDPLLTPTGKKLQDGTRAVARQIASDILPSIAETISSASPAGQASGKDSPVAAIAGELPTLVPKLGSRVFDAFSKQAQKQIELIQGDLADPSRIPERITKQAAEVAAEAKNVFSETPENLVGPEYTVVSRGEGYEIREYDEYDVASTSMAKVGEPYSMDDVASGGAAFNALAAYLFGANDEGKSMEMTTPVTTTSVGEMRFYLKKDGVYTGEFPQPLNEEDDRFNERGAVEIKHIPASRLAVARFTGFVTEGEVARQKDALLAALAADGVEVDVPHGQVVPHVVFQYNPPYTIPIVRRNEVAVPVRAVGSGDAAAAAADLETEWEEAIGDVDDEAGAVDDEVDHGGPDTDDVGPSDY
uniref:SOUL heme-binding protein n=2 Tax=Pseudictyota dubia TaxID=2749911 RepID=A0A7R9ZGF5_9STRA|mmetsp:Transcript_48580/g.90155  ORF Transcript_48580/g.90155 Transcript_48580/m.90155 type:complete len:498 (+) Transcript_48580:182-1675(+)